MGITTSFFALGFLKQVLLLKIHVDCKATFISLFFNESGPHLVGNRGFDGALKHSRASLVSSAKNPPATAGDTGLIHGPGRSFILHGDRASVPSC